MFTAVDVIPRQVDAAFAKAAAIGQGAHSGPGGAGTADAVKTVGRDKKTGEIRPCPADRFNRIVEINLVGTALHPPSQPRTRDARAAGPDGDRAPSSTLRRPPHRMARLAGPAMLPVSCHRGHGLADCDMMDEGIPGSFYVPGIFGTPLLLGLPGQRQPGAGHRRCPFPKRLTSRRTQQAVGFSLLPACA